MRLNGGRTDGGESAGEPAPFSRGSPTARGCRDRNDPHGGECRDRRGCRATPASADTASYSSAPSWDDPGRTPTFHESGPWVMSWSFDCATMFTIDGNFIVTVNQPAGSSISDIGPNKLHPARAAEQITTTTRARSTSQWTVAVPGTSPWPQHQARPAATPLIITSGQVGNSGDTTSFFVPGPWTMAWSYEAAAGSPTSCGGGVDGDFIVDVQQPLGGFTSDIGPNQLGGSGQGVNSSTLGLSRSPSTVAANGQSPSVPPAVPPQSAPTPLATCSEGVHGHGTYPGWQRVLDR